MVKEKIFDGGDLVIYHINPREGDLILPKDLLVEMKGKDITSIVNKIDIHIEAGKAVYYNIKLYPMHRRIKRKIEKFLERIL